MNGQPPLRIGDAEREGAVWALGEHYATGRLTQEEYDERATVAWAARTHADLAPLFADLPLPHGRPVAVGGPARVNQPVPVPAPPRRRHSLFPLLVVLVLLAALNLLPWFVVAIAVWFLWACRSPNRQRSR